MARKEHTNIEGESEISIPVFRPDLGPEDLEAVRRVFESGWIGPGPESQSFEEEFAVFVGAPHAVAVTSCSAALHLTLLALGLGPGDEVLLPSLSFISTAHAVSYCGARAVFVDVDSESCTLDPGDLSSKITPRSRAVIPVHYGGLPCLMEEIWELADRHGLSVIEDAAHACGAEYKGTRIGGLERTTATCFSFNAVKNLCTGDGGMVTTGSAELAQKVRDLRWMGIEKSTFDRSESRSHPLIKAEEYRWFYEVRDLGYKYIMNDIAAAIGRVQLRKIPELQLKRERMADRYTKAFSGMADVNLPASRPEARSAWHLYTLRSARREAIADYLRDRHITTSVHYLPLHLQPYYQDYSSTDLAQTERLWKELLTIPFHPGLTREETDRVVDAVVGFGETVSEGDASGHG